jgi:hypothetical protein
MSHNGTRRHFSPQEKVAILRRHLLENVPVSNGTYITRNRFEVQASVRAAEASLADCMASVGV